MPLYSYHCHSCNRLFNTYEAGDAAVCPDCQGVAPRRWSFTVSNSMKEHWNNAVGQYVSNRQQMSDALKRQGDEMSARTGLNHEYEMVDPADMRDAGAHGASEEHLDESRRRHDLMA